MDAVTGVEFREFVVASRQRLLRSAYLLTGDHARAEKLVGKALERVYRRWRTRVRGEDPERYALRLLVTMYVSRVREWAARGEQAIDRAAQRSADSTSITAFPQRTAAAEFSQTTGSTGSASSPGYAGFVGLGTPTAPRGRAAQHHRDERLSRVLDALRPRTRAVLVLGYYRDLPDPEVAELLGCSIGAVQREQADGLRVLVEAADAPQSPSPPRVPHPDGDTTRGSR